MLNRLSGRLFRAGWSFIKHRHVWAAAALLGLLLVVFSPGLFSDRLYSASDVLQQEPPFRFEDVADDFVPDNRLSGDAAIMFEPWRALDRRALEAGEFPLWNPHQGNGVPHLANSQSALIFPLTWVSVWLGPHWGILLSYIIKLFVGGFFTYLFLRLHKVVFWVALVAGAVSMVSAANLVWLPWPITDALVLLPLLLYLVERTHTRPSRWNYLWFTVALALTIFSGHLQTVIHLALIVGAYALLRLITAPAGSLKRRALRTLALAGAGLLGLSLAAVHLVPFVEYLELSRVWAERTAFGANPYVQPLRLFGLLFFPDLLGHPAWSWAPDFLDPGHANYNDSAAGYVGLATFMIAVAGLWYARHKKTVWFFVAVGLFALAMAFQTPQWFFDLVIRLPGLSTVNHIRILALFGFALIIIAALGVSAALTRSTSKNWRYSGVLIATLLCVVAATITIGTQLTMLAEQHADQVVPYLEYLQKIGPWPLAEFIAAAIATLFVLGSSAAQRRLTKLIIGILVASIALIPSVYRGMTYQPLVEPRYYYESSDLVTFLREHPTIERTISLSSYAHIWPNLASRFGFYDTRNYDSVDLQAGLKVLRGNVSVIAFTQAIKKANPNFLSAVGTRYLIAADYNELQYVLSISPEEALAEYPIAADFGDYKVFDNKRVWPRAFLVSDPEFYQYPERVDLQTVATIESYSNNSVSVLVNAPIDSYLVLSDSYYPGWVARVDGIEQTISQADLNLRAVQLNSGPHRVVFSYQPRSLRIGLWMSGATLLLLTLIGVTPPLYRRIKPDRLIKPARIDVRIVESS